MLEGVTGSLLGAPKPAVEAYKKMIQSTEWQHPKAWTSEGVTLLDYDLLMLPGGHEKVCTLITGDQWPLVAFVAFVV
jgi:hypothetical protein